MKIRKKLNLLLIGLIISILPTFATSNWVQIGNKMYIDTNSVRKENYSDSNYNNFYSVWIKWLNDGSKNFLNTENYYSAWGKEFLNPDGGINPIKLQNYIDQYVQNPFSARYAGTHARNIVGLINSGIAQQISSGDY